MRTWRVLAKLVTNDYISDYRSCLLKLGLLPLMYVLDFYDIMFFCKALKQPSVYFNILNFVQFSCTNTRSSSTSMFTLLTTSYSRNFYFTCLPRLWNRLPPIDLNQSLSTIKSTIHNYLWHHFNEHFDSTVMCTKSHGSLCSLSSTTLTAG